MGSLAKAVATLAVAFGLLLTACASGSEPGQSASRTSVEATAAPTPKADRTPDPTSLPAPSPTQSSAAPPIGVPLSDADQPIAVPRQPTTASVDAVQCGLWDLGEILLDEILLDEILLDEVPEADSTLRAAGFGEFLDYDGTGAQPEVSADMGRWSPPAGDQWLGIVDSLSLAVIFNCPDLAQAWFESKDVITIKDQARYGSVTGSAPVYQRLLEVGLDPLYFDADDANFDNGLSLAGFFRDVDTLRTAVETVQSQDPDWHQWADAGPGAGTEFYPASPYASPVFFDWIEGIQLLGELGWPVNPSAVIDQAGREDATFAALLDAVDQAGLIDGPAACEEAQVIQAQGISPAVRAQLELLLQHGDVQC